LIASTWELADAVIGFGLKPAIAGVGFGAFTSKLAPDDESPPGFATTMFQVRVATPVTMDAVIFVAVTPVTVSAVTGPPE
jgi:hypothetical protein